MCEYAQNYLQSMPTQKQIEEQELFERKQIRGGVDKLNFKTKNLKDKIYPSETFLIHHL